jgi:hypothetical protein
LSANEPNEPSTDMASRLIFVDGRDLEIALSGRRAAELLQDASRGGELLTRIPALDGKRTWVRWQQVEAIEERPGLS